VVRQLSLVQIPRVEDFPVMPCEIIKVSMKPVNFFDRNPAIDVPPSTQEFNKSVLAAEQHRQGGTEGQVESQAEACCTTTPSSKL
jgi:primary-amine oxidase